MEIGKKVNSLVRKHQTRNPFEMVKGMNVILVSYPLDGVRGFYQYFQRNNIIYIDENLPEHEKLFVCAHELGHMFLHKKSNAIFMDTRTHFTTSKYAVSYTHLDVYKRQAHNCLRCVPWLPPSG